MLSGSNNVTAGFDELDFGAVVEDGDELFRTGVSACASVARTASSASANSSARWKRRAGSLQRARLMIRLNGREIREFSDSGGAGSCSICAFMIAYGSSPENGRVPVVISYNITAAE
jgi:hypothetical protein